MDLTDAKEFTPVHTESPLKPHCTTSKRLATSKRLGDPQHGGVLFILPREIRDEIYSLVREGKSGGCVMSNAYATRIKTLESHFALLAVSKAIGQEFLERWLSGPNCRFHLLQFSDIDPVIPLPPKYTNCMKDLHLDLCHMVSCRHSFETIWGISTEFLTRLDPSESYV